MRPSCRGQFVDVTAEGLLYLAADLIAVLLQAVDQGRNPEQQVVQLVVKFAGGAFAQVPALGFLLALCHLPRPAAHQSLPVGQAAARLYQQGLSQLFGMKARDPQFQPEVKNR